MQIADAVKDLMPGANVALAGRCGLVGLWQECGEETGKKTHGCRRKRKGMTVISVFWCTI
jgi:hypothetical protein